MELAYVIGVACFGFLVLYAIWKYGGKEIVVVLLVALLLILAMAMNGAWN